MNKHMMYKNIAIFVMLSLMSCSAELQNDDIIGTWRLSTQSAAFLEIDLAESPASLEFVRGGVLKANSIPSYSFYKRKRGVYTGTGTWRLAYNDHSEKVEIVFPIFRSTWKGYFNADRNKGTIVLTMPIGDPDNNLNIEFERFSR